jgi:D-alanyl-D-alanine carboxypeptidase
MEKLKAQFAQYKVIQIVKKGEVIDKEVNLADGKFRKVKGVAAADFSYTLPQSKKGTIRKEYIIPESIKGEVREGQKLGEMEIFVENESVGKVDIVSPVYVPKANLFTRLIRMLGLGI